MKFQVLFVFLIVCPLGCSSEEGLTYEETFQDESPSWIYINMLADGDVPKIEYEGYDQELVNSGFKYTQTPGTFEFELIVRRVPFDELSAEREQWDNPKYVVVDFQGTIIRTDDNQFSLDGHMETKIPVILQFCKMIEKDDDSGEEFPEISFDAGDRDVNFEGTVIAWWNEEEDSQQ